MKSASYWIEHLELQAHPEGGHYREVYRSAEQLTQGLDPRFSGPRSICTSIYFLLEHGEFSALHRICSDELWHFHDGTGLDIHVIDAQDTYRGLKLGPNFDTGERYQHVVEHGALFGASVGQPGGYALVGCTVAPGFDFADFEMPSQGTLLKRYPQHETLIRALSRNEV